jgi:hypothetical protein
MTVVKGVWGAVDESLAARRNDIEDYRALVWEMFGLAQGVLRGFVMTPTVGSLAVDFTAGAAVVEQRGTDITGDGRGYYIYNDTTTVVTFNAPSAATRSDAVVFAWVDRQYGALGTGVTAGGPQIIVVPGVSGSSTPRTDAQIQTAIGVGGWFRYADVLIAPGNTVVAPGNITLTAQGVPGGLGPKYSVINASGNFTRADKPVAVGALVEVYSGGGGGGSVDGQASGQGESAGGAGGNYSKKWYSAAAWAALPKVIAVTVGAGGAGGTAGINPGDPGGASIFDVINVPGGLGGALGTSTTGTNGALGGKAGTAGTGGDTNQRGSDGGPGRVLAGAAAFNNCGGAAAGPEGGGATYFTNFSAGTGAAGKAPGGGGSGAFASTVDQVGGAGAVGRVAITEFFA